MLISALASWKRQLGTRIQNASRSRRPGRRRRSSLHCASAIESLEVRALLTMLLSGWNESVYVESLPQPASALTADQESGTLYVTDGLNIAGVLREVAPDGTVSTVVSNFSVGGGFFPYVSTDIQFHDGAVYTSLSNGTLARIDVATGTVSALHQFTGFNVESGMDVIGDTLYVTDGLGPANQLWKYDLSTGTAALVAGNLPGSAYGVEAGPNGSLYFAANVAGFYSVDLNTGTVNQVSSAASGVGNFAVDPAGEYLYARVADGVTRISLADGSVQAFLSGLANDNSDDLAFGPSSSGTGESLYVVSGTQLLEVSPVEAPGEIRGTKFEDLDGDGVRDAGEPGLAGVTIYLDLNDNGALDSPGTAEPVVVTGADGQYEFSGIAPGEYVVREIVPEGYRQTTPAAGPPRLFATTFFGTHRVQELDPATGAVLNELALPSPFASFTQGLAFEGGTLFYLENGAKVLYELDAKTGAVLDATPLGTQLANRNIGGLAAMNGLVYLLDTTSFTAAPGLLVFDPRTDQVTAAFPRLTGEVVEGGLAAVPGENLLVTSSASSEFLFLDPTTGAIRERVPYTATISNTTVTGLAVLNGEIYLTAGGRITDVISRDGELIRSFINPVESGALAGSSGTDGGHRISVAAGQIIAGLDFGNQRLAGEIRGTKFEDVDGDGSRDAGEPGLSGVKVYVDLDNDGEHDFGGHGEPDEYANGTDLTNAIPGVTLYVAGSNNLPTSLKVRAGSDTFSSTGSKVFFEEGIPFWTPGFRLRADLLEPVSRVSLDFISSSNSSSFPQTGRLEAYSATGVLLGAYTTQALPGGAVETMTIVRPSADVAYVVAYTQTGSFGRLDNLQFGSLDAEPFAVTDANGVYVIADVPSGLQTVREVIPEGYRQTSPGARDDFFYAIDASRDELVEINAVTGQVTRIGPHNAGVDLNGVVRTNSGELYAVTAFGSDSLYRLDPQTGAATLVGPTQMHVGLGLAYDPETDTIYGVGLVGAGQTALVVFDRTTGLATPVGSAITGVQQPFGAAWDAATDRLIVFDNSDDELYAFPSRGAATFLSHVTPGVHSFGLASGAGRFYLHHAGNRIHVLDPATGQHSLSLLLSEVVGVDGLEYVDLEPFARTILVEPSQTLTGVDFGNQRLIGEISGTKFEDVDGDGVRDPGEAALAGVKVYADLDNDGEHDFGGQMEPDAFGNGADLTNVAPGLTLSVAGLNNQPTGLKVRANTDFLNSTGEKVFFQEGISSWPSGMRLRADFAEPVSQVRLDFISSGPGQVGTLEVYDASGVLLDSCTTAGLSAGQIETMVVELAGGEIAYAVAYTKTGAFGRLDNLRFGSPHAEPFAVTDADGNYQMTLPSGLHVVREVVPEGYHQTSPGAKSDFFYAIDVIADELLEINAVTGQVTRIGKHNAGRDLHGVVRTNSGELYAITAFGTDALYRLDPATGAATLVGNTGRNVGLALAYDPASDTIYGVGQVGTATALVVLDPTTGLATPVSSSTITTLEQPAGAAWDTENNRLIVFDNIGNELYAFSPDGTATLLSVVTPPVGSFGLALGEGELYLHHSGNRIDVVDPATGQHSLALRLSEFVGVHGLDYVDLEPFAHTVFVEPSQSVAGIDFGNQRLAGKIRGTKFEDLDGDAVRDADEPGLAGVKVYLDLDGDGRHDLAGVEPDDFANGAELMTAVPGVTLTVAGSDNVSNTFFKVRAGTDANSSTGGKVFFEEGIPFWTSGFRFRADFEQPVSQVSLDFISSSDFGQRGMLEVYDAAGTLLASYTTESLSAGEVETMSITLAGGEIAYAVAYTAEGSFGRLDNLQFGPLNGEPFAITDGNGDYTITDVLPGQYVVREVVPEGYRQTSPVASSGTFYGTAYIIGSGGQMNLVEIDGATGEVTRIGAPLTRRLHGLVRTNSGDLYGINGFEGSLYRVDPATGALTLVGFAGLELTWGLAYDSATDTIYGIGNPGDGRNRLLIFDRATGEVTPIGPGASGLTGTSGLAFDPNTNRVIAFDNADDEFVAFDAATGMATRILQSSGINAWSLAFNGEHFVMQAVDTDNNTTMFTVDPVTGERSHFLTLSEPAPLETLDWSGVLFAHEVTVLPGQTVTGIDFGNKRLNRPPLADAGGPYTVVEGGSLTLDASASSDPDGDALNDAWDLDGDGEYDDAIGVGPTLTWSELTALGIADDGTFTIGLLVSDPDNASDAAVAEITVENAAPVLTGLNLDETVVLENGLVLLTGTFADPGTLDTHQITIDWGDGSAATIIDLTGGERGFTATHRYMDDNPTGTAADQYTIGVSVADDDGGSDTGSTIVTVRNVSPHVAAPALSSTTIGEDGSVTLTGTFVDPGTLDTHQVVIDWGDGTAATVIDLTGGERSFSATHQYLDDDPTGTPSDAYTIGVTVTDDDTGADGESVSVTVNNLDPVITSISSTAPVIGDAAEGVPVSVSATFTDVGTLDTHSATIDWGDGTASSAVITQGAGFGSLAASHTYQQGGVYTVVVTLGDDDTGQAAAATTAYVSGVGVHDGVLQIVGTSGDDLVVVNAVDGGWLRVHASFLPDLGGWRDVPSTGVELIQAFLGAGDDVFVLAGNIRTPLVVDAGAGNDHVKAGGGRSILIGGEGSDYLIGGSDEDILIAGTTAFDGEAEALRALLIEWASSRSLEERVANLYGESGTSDRENGDQFLTGGPDGTVDDDGAQDTLTGGADADWFLFDPELDGASMLKNELFTNDLDSVLS